MKNKFKTNGVETTIYYTRKNDGKKYKTTIDTADLDLASQLPGNWVVGFFGHKKRPYLTGNFRDRTPNGRNVLLHRWISGEPEKMVVDHKSGDTLDNRRSNLQVVTHSENLRKSELSTTKRKGTKPGHKNVHHSSAKKFDCVLAKQYWGCFKTQAEAIAQAKIVRAWLNWNRFGQFKGTPEPEKPVVPIRKQGRPPKTSNVSPEEIDKIRAQRLQYSQTDKARERVRRYQASEKGKAAVKRAQSKYWASEKGRAARKRSYAKQKALFAELKQRYENEVYQDAA